MTHIGKKDAIFVGDKQTVKERMKIRILLFLFTTVFVSTSIYGQEQKDTLPVAQDSEERYHRKLYIYTWGMPDFTTDKEFECQRKLADIYGVSKISKAGCVLTVWQRHRWERHNRHVRNKLERRLGKNWELRYNDDLKKCIG